MLVLYIMLFVGGLAILLFGADKLADTASHIAERLGVNPIIIGMTILAVGTSIPEMANAAVSFGSGVGAVAFGDIIGSDLVQITLILGVVALINPLKGKRKEILYYGVTDLLALFLAFFAIHDGIITWKDGILLVLSYLIFIGHLVANEHITKHHFKKKHDKHWAYHVLLIITGFILVFAGSRAIIYATQRFAELFNWPAYIVAFLIVGLGTSLPELAVAASAARKKQFNLSIGTLLGSNITDPTLSLGFGALFTKATVVPQLAISHLVLLMMVTAIVISAFALKRKFTRAMGVGAVALYVVTILLL